MKIKPDNPHKILLHKAEPKKQKLVFHLNCFRQSSKSKSSFIQQIFYFILLFFLGLHLWHMEFPRLRVQSELQLPAYARATATQDLSLICHLHLSSWQCQILDPLSKTRDRTHNLMVPSRIHFHCTTTETPTNILLTTMLCQALCKVLWLPR